MLLCVYVNVCMGIRSYSLHLELQVAWDYSVKMLEIELSCSEEQVLFNFRDISLDPTPVIFKCIQCSACVLEDQISF